MILRVLLLPASATRTRYKPFGRFSQEMALSIVPDWKSSVSLQTFWPVRSMRSITKKLSGCPSRRMLKKSFAGFG